MYVLWISRCNVVGNSISLEEEDLNAGAIPQSSVYSAANIVEVCTYKAGIGIATGIVIGVFIAVVVIRSSSLIPRTEFTGILRVKRHIVEALCVGELNDVDFSHIIVIDGPA